MARATRVAKHHAGLTPPCAAPGGSSCACPGSGWPGRRRSPGIAGRFFQWNCTVCRCIRPAASQAACLHLLANSRCKRRQASSGCTSRITAHAPAPGGPGGVAPAAGAGHRRERHGHQRLGVVGQAMLLVGVGPGPVEHILAVGVVLEVQRAGGMQPSLPSPQRDEAGRPARGRVALPLSCMAARYSWRMKGLAWGCQQCASRAFQSPAAFTSSGDGQPTRMT
jgi:hypothetical protein